MFGLILVPGVEDKGLAVLAPVKGSAVLAPDYRADGVVLLLPLPDEGSVDRCVPALAPVQQPVAKVVAAMLAAPVLAMLDLPYQVCRQAT